MKVRQETEIEFDREELRALMVMAAMVTTSPFQTNFGYCPNEVERELVKSLVAKLKHNIDTAPGGTR